MRHGLMIVIALCAGCAGGVFDSKQPPQQTYVISAAPPVDGTPPALAVSLAVARPSVAPGLYTERIVVRQPDRRLDYFAASRWGATSDVLVQSLLVESLRNSRRLASVQGDLSVFNAQYLLHTELQDFQAEYIPDELAPRVRVRLTCTLGRARAREPMAQFGAGVEVQAANNTLRAVVAAFEAAYRETAQAVVEQTLRALQADSTPGSRAE